MGFIRHVSATQHEGSHGIDLAPMLDFVLNLLIFFIITAVFVKEFGLTVNRPSGEIQSGAAGEQSAMPIQILSTGEIFIDERVVDLRAVRANVERVHAVNPKKGVLIIAEEKAQTGIVIQVIDQIHEGGVYDISFSTSR
jgi:biopolymer transport protein ExbD